MVNLFFLLLVDISKFNKFQIFQFFSYSVIALLFKFIYQAILSKIYNINLSQKSNFFKYLQHKSNRKYLYRILQINQLYNPQSTNIPPHLTFLQIKNYMKQQQKIIKKGDYYQIQIYQETMMALNKSKRQQTPIVSSTNIPASQYILNDLPTYQQARQKYFTHDQVKKQYSTKNIVDLKIQLEEMLKNDENINDQDRKEIQKLMEQMDDEKDSKLVLLNSLPERKKQLAKQDKAPTSTQISLTALYNISSISSKIQQLQQLDFPQLHLLQHQLQILLGQKKQLKSIQLLSLTEKEKQQLNNVYNHLNRLTILNNISQTVQNISLNEQKHVEMKKWLEKNYEVHELNNDFLKQLKQDAELVEKLEINFKNNIEQVRQILKQLKTRSKK